MTFQFTLQKVLEVKEHQKTEDQLVYREALKKFEDVATELYNHLKKKEDLLEIYERKISNGVPISEIQQTQENVRFLELQIDRLQQSTQMARSAMNESHLHLMASAVDVKKFEKIKEKKHEQFEWNQKQLENKFLDEVSVQQYLNR
ncbi:flagellar export protein FliJ [Evansella tamaricis]|uniref:Flagellar export protein FliJ n=1 Tax=Evansella tamaricis TaxID=2069301 RepID=A0ABS6JLL1_9BACI|nr:flagellar export protein FliJ [Evansella tamaricis]MBU9714552.1 flagellar export protein FliJ [Evansella tamaricis]